MIIDFHTHGKLTKKFPLSTEYTDWMVREAYQAGLDAICLTEHFNTLQFDELYGYLIKTCTREGDTLVTKDGLRIFTGMETDIAEGGHILSIGTPEDILELNARLEPYKEEKNYLPFEKLMDLFDEYPVIVGGAHPYREGVHTAELPIEQLKRLHFFDLNGKDLAFDRAYYEEATSTLAKKVNIPMVSGSDTHQAAQYGCIYTKFTKTVKTVEELHSEIKKGDYEIVVADKVSFQVRTAGLVKKALKEIHALGGDYISVLTSPGLE